MTTITLHPLAQDYLTSLEHACRRLPRRERRELVEEIEAHLAEATDAGMSTAEVLTVLDRLGAPEDIAAAQQPDEPAGADRRGRQEWAAIFLLLLGGFAIGIGWIVGLIFLWSSRAWSTRDKLIGTFVVPGGLAGTWFGVAFLALGSISSVCSGSGTGPTHCSGGPSTIGEIAAFLLFAFLVIGPIFTSVYLARRAR